MYARASRVLALLTVMSVTAACGGGGGDDPAPSPSPGAGGGAAVFALNATVSGLTGSGLTLRNNGAGSIAVSANGTVGIATGLASGTAYSITIGTQPTGQQCQVTAGTGTISVANAAVTVACLASSTYSITLTVAGSTGSLSIQNLGGPSTGVPGNGTYTLASGLATGTPYGYQITNSPVGQACTISNGAGTISTANVAMSINCTTSLPPGTFTVSGTVTGLAGNVFLQNNGAGSISINANGSALLVAGLANGAGYNLTVVGIPSGQTCQVTNGSGTITNANVTNVLVTCVPRYTVTATVTGAASAFTLRTNGGTPYPATNGVVTVASGPTGLAYNVTVATPPVGQTCLVGNGSGTINGANVSNVTVTCSTPNTYSVTATVSGAASPFALQVNGAGSVQAVNGQILLATLPQGASYNVSVLTRPAGQVCGVTNGSGTVNGANVTNIAVTCVNVFSVTATVSGLTGVGLTLRNSGDSGDLQVAAPANGPVVISNVAQSGETYSVGIARNPTGQSCTVANGVGTVASGNVSDIAIRCAASNTAYSITASVTGLTGTGLVLRNGSTLLPVVSAGATSVTIASSATSGSSYNVSVQTQPTASPSQSCRVVRGGGHVDGANVNDIQIDCRERVGRFLYVPNAASVDVSGYSIDAATGALTPLAGFPLTPPAPVPAGSVTRQVILQKTPDDQFLAVARLNSSPTSAADNAGTFSIYRVDAATGALTLTSSFTTQPELRFSVGAIHPNGRQWVVASWFMQQSATVAIQDGDAVLNILDINPGSGQLTIADAALPAPGFTPGVYGPSPIVLSAGPPQFHPSGNSISWPVTFGGQSYAIANYSAAHVFRSYYGIVDPLLWMYLTNGLNVLQASPSGSPPQVLLAGGLGFDPSGEFMVAAGNSVTTSTGTITGTVTAQAGTIAVSLLEPRSGVFESRAADTSCSNCWVFAPAFSGDGRFVYVTNPAYQIGTSVINANPGGSAVGPASIAGFSANPTTGALAQVPGSPAATGQSGLLLSGLVQHPTAPYVYLPVVGDGTGSGIAVMQRDAVTGALTPVGARVSAGPTARVSSMRMDVSGRYLYVTDSATNQIHVYTTNASTGAVTLSSSTATGQGPSLAVVVGSQAP